MGKRVTIYDIATELGISIATVNRALTGKGRVSEETRQRVFEATERMGFRPNALARSLNRRPIRLAVVVCTGFPEFQNAILEGAQETQEALIDYNVRVEYFVGQSASNSRDGQEFLRRTLSQIAESGYDGLMICGKQVEEFQLLADKNICVATVVNDIAPEMRHFCVQYNGYVAGKMAAELLHWMGEKGRPVAVATGSIERRSIHTQIQEGFRLQARRMELEIAEVYRQYDNADCAFEETRRVLRTYPNLGGIYVDSFNSQGVIEAVRSMGAENLRIVTSDIYKELCGYIEDGTVCASIFQNQREQGKFCLMQLYHAIADNAEVQDVIQLSPQVILRSNLELFIR